MDRVRGWEKGLSRKDEQLKVDKKGNQQRNILIKLEHKGMREKDKKIKWNKWEEVIER